MLVVVHGSVSFFRKAVRDEWRSISVCRELNTLEWEEQ